MSETTLPLMSPRYLSQDFWNKHTLGTFRSDQKQRKTDTEKLLKKNTRSFSIDQSLTCLHNESTQVLTTTNVVSDVEDKL